MHSNKGNNMNPKRLFVGNLTYSVDEKQLWGLFSKYGEVVGVRIIEGKGYGFVEMESYEDARTVRNALNETEFMGRNLLIDDVRPPKSKTGFQNRSGGRFQGQKPTYGKSASPRGKSGSGTRGKSSQRSGKNAPTRQRESDYSERTLRSAPRPDKKDTAPAGKNRPSKTPPRDDKPAQKKTKTRFWPGGSR